MKQNILNPSFRILLVFGTRPEAIKMAPLVKALTSGTDFKIKVCVTGQHREMLDQVLQAFNIVADYDLNLMKTDQDLTDITRNVLAGMKTIFRQWKPDWVFVHGDTTTTASASLAAFYEKISVAHVEAGLRTGNIYSPWPEEMNRRLTSALSQLHFAPTSQAKKNLLNEGVPEKQIIVTGNTVIDALLEVSKKLRDTKGYGDKFETMFSFLDSSKNLILVTGHRRENFGVRFDEICNALKILAKRDDIEIIFPVHPNPCVQKPVYRILANVPRVHLITPLSYLPFVFLMNRAKIIITDSGGIQEEAPSLGKPVLVLREVTERPEAVEAGTVKLVGANKNLIISEVCKLIDNPTEYKKMAMAHNPYGDGLACERIVTFIKTWLRNEYRNRNHLV